MAAHEWMWTLQRLAGMLGVPAKHIYQWVRDHHVPHLLWGEHDGRVLVPCALAAPALQAAGYSVAAETPDVWRLFDPPTMAKLLHVSLQTLVRQARNNLVPAWFMPLKKKRLVYPAWLVWRYIQWRVVHAPDRHEPLRQDMLLPQDEPAPPAVIWWEPDLLDRLRIQPTELHWLCSTGVLPHSHAKRLFYVRSADVIRRIEELVLQPVLWSELQELWSHMSHSHRTIVVETARALRATMARGSVVKQAAPPPWGQRLRQLRRAKGLTQQALADLMAISRSVVAALECAPNRPPQHTIQSLADALHVEIDELLPCIQPAGASATLDGNGMSNVDQSYPAAQIHKEVAGARSPA